MRVGIDSDWLLQWPIEENQHAIHDLTNEQRWMVQGSDYSNVTIGDGQERLCRRLKEHRGDRAFKCTE